MEDCIHRLSKQLVVEQSCRKKLPPGLEHLGQQEILDELRSQADMLNHRLEQFTLELEEPMQYAENLVDQLITARKDATRAQRETANLQTVLLKLPDSIRQQILELLVPRSGWLTFFNRPTKTDIIIMQVCSKLRKEAMRMMYNENLFAIDLRSLENCRLAWQWLETLGNDAIAMIQKLRISTVVECLCEGSIEARSSFPVVKPGNRDQCWSHETIHQYRLRLR